jgi:hypothetical protein
MSVRRALSVLAVVGLLFAAGCSKTADKGKTEDQLVAAGFTKDQAKCITNEIWDRIPKKERDRLTAADAQLTNEQQAIVGQAEVKCARDKFVDQVKSAISATNTSITPDQVDCILGKLSDADLAKVAGGDSAPLTDAVTGCVSSS